MANENKKILTWPGGRLDFSDGCVVMGILNVTPDSFSDGGQFFDVERAVEHGRQMARDGAAIIDVGPQSTRPGSEPVDTAEQIKRAVPVIGRLSKELEIPISIDSLEPEVATAAIDAGANMINDITALQNDQMASLAAQKKVPVILMHMQATPATMQDGPHYDDVAGEVLDFLIGRAKNAQSFGIAKEMIFIDPGLGFGKTTEHNIALLKNIDKFIASGYRVLVGASRKRFLGQLAGRQNPAERVFATAATTALCAAVGVSIVRVHDVPEMVDVIKVARAIWPKLCRP